MKERAFPFIKTNERQTKPRSQGNAEIRGPYYTPLGKRYLENVLETTGRYVDSLEFAGESCALMTQTALRELIETAHRFDVLVSTGGFLERALTQDSGAAEPYIAESRDTKFDIIEISGGFITMPTDDWLRLIEKVQQVGLKAKPEVSIQFGAGGATPQAELEAEGTRDVDWVIARGKRFLEVGAYIIMIESEGITESVRRWRTDVVGRIAAALELDKVIFEAAEPEVFAWYIKNYGPEVNLFVDHSQIVQLECLRSGIWGTESLWGRVLTYKE